MVYSFHWVRISRDEKNRQASQSTDTKPETSTTNLIQTKSTPNSHQCLPEKSPEK